MFLIERFHFTGTILNRSACNQTINNKDLITTLIFLRQPESSDRPTFPQLVELLSRADFELFGWEEEDLRNSDPMQVKTIGAPLETAKNLYPDLQKSYITQDY